MNQNNASPAKNLNERLNKIIAKRYAEKDGNKLKELAEKLNTGTFERFETDINLKKSFLDLYKEDENTKFDFNAKTKKIPENRNKLIIGIVIVAILLIGIVLIVLIRPNLLTNINHDTSPSTSEVSPNSSANANPSSSTSANLTTSTNDNKLSPQDIYDLYNNIEMGMTVDEFKLTLDKSFTFDNASISKTEFGLNYSYKDPDSGLSMYINENYYK